MPDDRGNKLPDEAKKQQGNRGDNQKGLDEALEDTFPASDPPAMLEPRQRRASRGRLPETDEGSRMMKHTVTRSDVVRLFGDIEDRKVVDILAIQPIPAELEEAAAWLGQEDDVMGELRRPLTGRAAQIYEIVRRGEEDEVDEDSARR